MEDKKILLEIPKIHTDVVSIGAGNFYPLKKAYSEVIGVRNFDHFSINIESPEGELAFLSCNPVISLILINSGLLPYDGSVSPTIYRKKNMYIWDKCYVPEYAEKIKKIKEYKFGIKKGVVLHKKVNNFHIMYSFATKSDEVAFLEDVIESMDKYLKIGDHCYSLIRPIYAQYLTKQDAPMIR